MQAAVPQILRPVEAERGMHEGCCAAGRWWHGCKRNGVCRSPFYWFISGGERLKWPQGWGSFTSYPCLELLGIP